MDREFQSESNRIFFLGGTRSGTNRLMKCLLGCLFYTFLDQYGSICFDVCNLEYIIR
jgi:hypothetical protein